MRRKLDAWDWVMIVLVVLLLGTFVIIGLAGARVLLWPRG